MDPSFACHSIASFAVARRDVGLWRVTRATSATAAPARCIARRVASAIHAQNQTATAEAAATKPRITALRDVDPRSYSTTDGSDAA
ncbi:MAG: hypothetical protein R3D60_13830 [Paracoccaceae bacterium]